MIAGPYLDLLENDPAFRMSSYLAVEKSLRDRGFTEEARQIFIAGTYRDVRTKSGKGPTSESTSWRRGDDVFVRRHYLIGLSSRCCSWALAAGAYFGIDYWPKIICAVSGVPLLRFSLSCLALQCSSAQTRML